MLTKTLELPPDIQAFASASDYQGTAHDSLVGMRGSAGLELVYTSDEAYVTPTDTLHAETLLITSVQLGVAQLPEDLPNIHLACADELGLSTAALLKAKRNLLTDQPPKLWQSPLGRLSIGPGLATLSREHWALSGDMRLLISVMAACLVEEADRHRVPLFRASSDTPDPYMPRLPSPSNEK